MTGLIMIRGWIDSFGVEHEVSKSDGSLGYTMMARPGSCVSVDDEGTWHLGEDGWLRCTPHEERHDDSP